MALFVLALLTWLSAGVSFRTNSQDASNPLVHFDAWQAQSKSFPFSVGASGDIKTVVKEEQRVSFASNHKISALVLDEQMWHVQAKLLLEPQTAFKKLAWPSSPDIAVFYLKFTQDNKLLHYASVKRIKRGKTQLSIDELVSVPIGANHVKLGVALRHSGEWSIEGVKVSKVKVSTRYKCSRFLLAISWFVFIATVAFAAFKVMNVKRLLALSIVLMLVFLATAAPQSLVSTVMISMRSALENVITTDLKTTVHTMYKYSHTIIFFLLGLVLFVIAQLAKVSKVQCFVFGVGVALATEALQRHAFTRSAEMHDLILDVLGLLLAFAVCGFFGYLFARMKRRNTIGYNA